MAKSRKKNRSPRKVLRIPDLEHSKHAVLNSLPAKASQESYEYAIDEFISWYCSEPRLAFNRTVVLRYRFFLEQKNLAPSTINVRLAAVRRLAYEASDSGLLSPELAAGIARVKGAKQLGIRIGNWLTAEQGRALLQGSRSDTLRGKRGSCDPGCASRLWASPRGNRRYSHRRPTASGRTLGYCRPRRKGQAYPDCADSCLGQKGC